MSNYANMGELSTAVNLMTAVEAARVKAAELNTQLFLAQPHPDGGFYMSEAPFAEDPYIVVLPEGQATIGCEHCDGEREEDEILLRGMEATPRRELTEAEIAAANPGMLLPSTIDPQKDFQYRCRSLVNRTAVLEKLYEIPAPAQLIEHQLSIIRKALEAAEKAFGSIQQLSAVDAWVNGVDLPQ